MQFGYIGSELKRIGCPGDVGELTGHCDKSAFDTWGLESAKYYTVVNGVPVPKEQAEVEAIKQAEQIQPTIAAYQNALQDAMDKLAGEWGYGCPPGSPGSIGYAIGTYFNSTNAQWKADVQALQTWLESVWQWANEQQTAILADPSKLPGTPAEFISDMPAAPTKPTIS